MRPGGDRSAPAMLPRDSIARCTIAIVSAASPDQRGRRFALRSRHHNPVTRENRCQAKPLKNYVFPPRMIRKENWQRWGTYLSERQWGTVREDYSANGDCWNYLPHDHARSRAYRWGEDGLLG